MYFYMAVCLKTLDKKTSIDAEKISGETCSTEQTVRKLDLMICVNPGLS